MYLQTRYKVNINLYKSKSYEVVTIEWE